MEAAEERFSRPETSATVMEIEEIVDDPVVPDDTSTKPGASVNSIIPVAIEQPGASSSGIIPRVHNVSASVDLRCKLDLVKIALRVKNTEFNPRRFHGVIMRIQNPLTTALVFGKGKMVVTGARTESDAHLAARKYARILQKLGFDVKFSNFKIQSLFATCDCRFPIQLERLYSSQYQFARYEPELFPGLIYRMVKPRMVFLIFVTGKMIIAGGSSRGELTEAVKNLYPVLKTYRKQ